MKNAALTFASFAAFSIFSHGPICAQQVDPSVLLSAEPSAQQTVESVSSFAQCLLSSVLCLGLAIMALWAVFAWLGVLASASKGMEAKLDAPKLDARASLLLLFACISLAQCRVASDTLVKPFDSGVNPGYGQHDLFAPLPHQCERVSTRYCSDMSQYTPICKYCGRHMEQGLLPRGSSN